MRPKVLFTVLLLVGLYFPSSSGEGMSAVLTRAFFAVSLILLVVLALRVGVNKSIFLWISCPIVIWLALCTFLSLFSLSEITLTPLAIFSPLAFLLSIRAGRLRPVSITSVLAIVSIANVCMAVAMVFVESFSGFMAAHYNDFSSELVMDMVALNKPVLTFATHSLAGMFIYFFFWLNFRTYQKTRKRLHLVLAVLHIVICIALMSITSLAFSLLAIAELAWNFQWVAALSAVSAYLLIPLELKQAFGDTLSAATLFREGGGFLARYSTGGTLANAFTYIHNHPFLPMGLMYSHNLFEEGAQTDSGPLLYFLRGSIVLVLLMYGGFFFFLRRNLLNKWDCYRLFLAILITELGAVVLVYPRSFLLIPAFVIYLNSLPPNDGSRFPSPRSGNAARSSGYNPQEISS